MPTLAASFSLPCPYSLYILYSPYIVYSPTYVPQSSTFLEPYLGLGGVRKEMWGVTCTSYPPYALHVSV